MVALCPNESRFAPVVAVIPKRSFKYRWPYSAWRTNDSPEGMLQSGSIHQPPTTCSRPSAILARSFSNSGGSLSSTHAKKSDESHVKTNSGYSSMRSTAD
jgi:hypothetical protein